MNTAILHETDFYGWTQQQADLIRSGQVSGLDMTNILKEITGLGESKINELENQLTILFAHLLKWKFQLESHTKIWAATLKEQQHIVAKLIGKNPSLHPQISTIITTAYNSVLFMASHESSIAKYNFPKQCPWTLDEALGFVAKVD